MIVLQTVKKSNASFYAKDFFVLVCASINVPELESRMLCIFLIYEYKQSLDQKITKIIIIIHPIQRSLLIAS